MCIFFNSNFIIIDESDKICLFVGVVIYKYLTNLKKHPRDFVLYLQI